jgi:hypothetical protein
MDEETIQCPYCGASFTALIDWSDAGGSYIQDCEICCQPILFRLHLSADGGPGHVSVDREQD